MTTTPARFISVLRASDPKFMENLFMNGGCFHLFKLLKMMWPDAEPWYDLGHVITRIDGRFYDITGCVSSRGFRRMSKSEQREGSRFLGARLKKHSGEMCVCLEREA